MGIGILLLLGIGICLHIHKLRRRAPTGEDARELIREAAAVTSDFLEAGQVVSLLSGGNYLGTISLRLLQGRDHRARYSITMYDSGNIRLSFAEYQKGHPELLTRETEAFRVLKGFLEKYGGCYDLERNALVYVTKHSAGYETALEGEAELRNRIARHPLAEMTELSRIHTKYVGERG